MSLEKKTVRAWMPLSTVHSLLAKGELGRVLTIVGIETAFARSSGEKFPFALGNHRPQMTFAIKFESESDELGALLVGIKPACMPRGLVPNGCGAWVLFEPLTEHDWEADLMAIDPHFPSEARSRQWDFYAELALELRKDRQ